MGKLHLHRRHKRNIMHPDIGVIYLQKKIINKEQQNLLDSHSVKEHGMKLIADMPGMKSISYYMSSILENSEMIYSYNTPENIYGSRDIAQLFTLS